MSLLETLQLIGYSLGAVLPLWLAYVLLRQRVGLVTVERLLLALAACMVGWHGGNLVVTLRSLLGLPHADWIIPLRVANTIALISIAVCYSLLLHVHLHLWAGSHNGSLNRTERIRAVLSYVPCAFLVIAIPRIWSGSYQPMITKESSFVLPFSVWVVYSLSVCAITELLVARRSKTTSERRILRTLAVSFFGIAGLILSALGLGLGRGNTAGLYLQTFANLGSLLPSALLAYYIYRYRYLELIIKESLVVATFAAVVLAVYVYGIRDRKSTRLNSSHSSISYAVFCLKKKNNINMSTTSVLAYVSFLMAAVFALRLSPLRCVLAIDFTFDFFPFYLHRCLFSCSYFITF